MMRPRLVRMISGGVCVIAGMLGRMSGLSSMLVVSRCMVVIAMARRMNGMFIILAGMLLSGAGGSIVMVGVVGIFISVTVPVTSL